MSRAGVSHVNDLLVAGFVPIMHGDCVLDTNQGCSILSGDKIVEVSTGTLSNYYYLHYYYYY